MQRINRETVVPAGSVFSLSYHVAQPQSCATLHTFFVSLVPGGTEVTAAAMPENRLSHNPNSNKLLGDAFPFLWFVLEMGFHSIAHAGPKLISILLPRPPKC